MYLLYPYRSPNTIYILRLLRMKTSCIYYHHRVTQYTQTKSNNLEPITDFDTQTSCMVYMHLPLLQKNLTFSDTLLFRRRTRSGGSTSCCPRFRKHGADSWWGSVQCVAIEDAASRRSTAPGGYATPRSWTCCLRRLLPVSRLDAIREGLDR